MNRDALRDFDDAIDVALDGGSETVAIIAVAYALNSIGYQLDRIANLLEGKS